MASPNRPPVPDLAALAAAFGIALSAAQVAQFEQYRQLLIEWNERINLTAITDPADIQVRHFLDSLTCALATGDLNGQSLVDVGTGAGFPGLPLKILYPELKLTLVESVAKKTHFLQAAVQQLALSEVTVISERAETIGQSMAHRGRYDWAAARAVAEMRILAEYLLPLCRPGGHMLAQKGENAPAETEAAARAIQTLGGGPPQLYAIQLPQREEQHYLVVIEKINQTPPTYPRRPGMATKRPL
jgi:16S rRNA (guanine527-N7)-methyltransferase